MDVFEDYFGECSIYTEDMTDQNEPIMTKWSSLIDLIDIFAIADTGKKFQCWII